MLTALVCYAAHLDHSSQATPIRFVPSDKSPFTGSQRVIASASTDRPGIVVFEETGVANELNLSLRKALSDTRIVSIIQRAGKNEYTTVPKLDLPTYRKGLPTSSDISIPGDHPQSHSQLGDWFDQMKIGESSIVFDHRNFYNESMPIQWHPSIAGIIIDHRIAVEIQNTSPFGQKGYGGWGTTIEQLGTIQTTYINIKFTAKIYDFMGTMDSVIGAKRTVDGIRFQITNHSTLNLKAEEPFAASVKQTGRAGKWWYKLEPCVTEDDPVSTWRNNYKQNPFKMPPENKAIDGTLQTELLIRGSRAVKAWQGINVLRCTEISGYYSHVPTRPINAP